ncbi:CRT (chloroquine-resistance transporter)-liketransporter 1 [Striga asiatica]|uniref:CRT (Chloroquine-resistance transporter)-liketransporter 1 n=1 Tax=Striga asiatica TaxID=4170 RepID=A0A5A7Q663_STRAF|nr:CRT (chloroquine-resistance transporter)-liketransporter 1 [Striga asiatica]
MSACCRQMAASAAATQAAGQPILLHRASLSVNFSRVGYLQSWVSRGAGAPVLRSRRWLITASVARRGEEEEDGMKVTSPPPPRCCAFDRDAVALAGGGGAADRRAEVMVAAVATVVLGVGNRVLYKLALVPLKHYPFFLAQLATFGSGKKVSIFFGAQVRGDDGKPWPTTVKVGIFETACVGLIVFYRKPWHVQFLESLKVEIIGWIRPANGVDKLDASMATPSLVDVPKFQLAFFWVPTQPATEIPFGFNGIWYVIVYFAILYLRYQAGKVTDEMLSLPKSPLIAVGLLEALAAASGMAAGAILSGAAIPILSQSFLVWQLVLSYIFLGRRYRFHQLFGCFLVAVGVIVTVASGSGPGSLMEAGIFWSVLMIISFLLQAADTILKEIIFADASQRLKGGTVDLFVVNSFGSAYQAIFICLLLPFLSNLWGIPFGQLPNYLKDGAACFLNAGTMSNRCNGAPLLPVLFVIVNMGFNISLLHLLKISSAVLSCLASTVSVPISVYLFTLPLPYLGVASSLPPGFVAGAIILVFGLLVYVWPPPRAAPPL